MSHIFTKAKSGSPWRRRRLSASLIVLLLLLGGGADFAPALAAGSGDPNLSVATSSSTLAGGTAKLIVGTLRRQSEKYLGGYRLKVFGPVAYSATGTKDFANWKTAPVLKPRGKAEWDGVIKEQDIKGNLKWVTKSGETRYYFINGKKR